MTTMTVSALITEMAKLPENQQLILNKALVDLIRRNRKIKAAVEGTKFLIGDVVRFDAKRKGIKFIKIEKFNRAGTAVVGYECDKDGFRFQTATRWTVATTLCSKI